MLRISKLLTFLFLASMVSVTTVDAQTPDPVAADKGGTAQAPDSAGGCTVNLSDCGRSGALFGRRQACNACGDCGAADGCGGCVSVGSFGGGGLMDRVKDYVFPSDGCGGRYRSVFGGWSDMQDYNGTGTLDATFNDGFILGTARGRYLSKNLRMEMESNWRNNSGDDLITAGVPAQLDGQFNMFSTMINTVREFGCGRVQPYVGAGIGLGIQDGDFDSAGDHYRLDDWTFAYQGILGMNISQSKCRDFYFEYRYYGNGTTQIEDSAGVDIDDFDFQSENIVFGIRFKR